jgi:hypothetical protein
MPPPVTRSATGSPAPGTAPEPRHPHRRDRADPSRHRRPRLLPAQARRIQDATGSTALPQAPDLRRDLPPARGRHPGCGCGPGRALGGVLAIQRGRSVHPGHRLFGEATSRTRNTDATADRSTCEPPHRLGSSLIASTRRSRQGGAPRRTNDLDGDQRRRTLHGAETPLLTQRGTMSVNIGWPRPKHRYAVPHRSTVAGWLTADALGPVIAGSSAQRARKRIGFRDGLGRSLRHKRHFAIERPSAA